MNKIYYRIIINLKEQFQLIEILQKAMEEIFKTIKV